ncbi:MAG: HPr family phosphocarrier protein [Desulfobacterales bacterium]|nr:HPr family phosphocarrier protein [Desulfobacterales bacterium]
MQDLTTDTKILRFSQMASHYSKEFLICCKYISTGVNESGIFTKKFYSTWISASNLLEDFLDTHGAKNNKNWYFYRELTATVRHLSIAAYGQKHILNRIEFYNLSNEKKFSDEGRQTIKIIKKALHSIAPVILNEAQRLNIHIPEEEYTISDFPDISTGYLLDFDINDKNWDKQKKNIVTISSSFLNIAKNFNEFKFYQPYSKEEITDIVPVKVNEVEMRHYEMLVHNLQSSFDTYVIQGGGGHIDNDVRLKKLRGIFSVILHLLEIIGPLLHYYERHLYERGCSSLYKTVRDMIANFIDPYILLDRTINYGLYFICHFFSAGKKLATEILNENIERSEITVGIPRNKGFHLRPSMMVAKIVQYFGGEVTLCIGDSCFDASSTLSVQWAGGLIQKENIDTVNFKGDVRALKDIQILADVNYGEDLMGKGVSLPKELSYLK